MTTSPTPFFFDRFVTKSLLKLQKHGAEQSAQDSKWTCWTVRTLFVTPLKEIRADDQRRGQTVLGSSSAEFSLNLSYFPSCLDQNKRKKKKTRIWKISGTCVCLTLCLRKQICVCSEKLCASRGSGGLSLAFVLRSFAKFCRFGKTANILVP